ncbi:MAG: APC family permease [Methanohalobium sp.]|uniref:APC family permease n=1 Tax=Methanohalobium sp. TaxID=2837493 RepID=UPI00397CD0A7
MAENEEHELLRAIDWKQGLAIALGVPLLVLPSIGYFAFWLWGFAIAVWAISVIQGFFQNYAYGELAVMFPKASGLPGFAQNVFKGKGGRFDRGKLIGGFSAWGYWFAWNPVMAIMAILIGTYLHQMIPWGISQYALSITAGVVIFGGLLIVNSRGLSSGALVGMILAIISIAPLVIIAGAPFATGDFNLGNITNSWFPADWAWDLHHILILLGIFAMAEWSACAWETAAVYGPEYNNPSSDLPKALFVCGFVCLIIFVLVQTSVIGTLGIETLLDSGDFALLPVAQAAFGQIGSYLAIFVLMVAMILIIQTAFLGSSRAMHSMAKEGNLPPILGRTNSAGTPINAMILTAVFNLILIGLQNPAAVLAASAIGYSVANGISLFSYVKAKTDSELSKIDRPFKAPKGWKYVALIFGILNIPLFLIGVIYLNSLELGSVPTYIGLGVLAVYIPIWYYTQHKSYQQAGAS